MAWPAPHVTRPPKKRGRPPIMVAHPHTGQLVRRSDLIAQNINPETGAVLSVSATVCLRLTG